MFIIALEIINTLLKPSKKNYQEEAGVLILTGDAFHYKQQLLLTALHLFQSLRVMKENLTIAIIFKI